ncbi:alpha/beta hydrolase family protein [Sphingopyxis panaciterrulae]|uniref:Dipeptidyl aminopeptidase/acylaminoacyl peptidase n=1 Tax=Sphingopyxis panaciterrulae TaxID=462372 RepID=A0A7W9B2X5_9SPHN|nr:S9 family peptidase [Sphingopyxis panaciterrulae]MBB5704976.1 dipeptidyl aminopeptidase/acylaminoacyl peptidase [Sphingopyxis panaciterrulae]
MVRLLFLILLSALAGPLAAQSAPADTSAAAAPSPSVATIGPLATEAFARLPFVEKPALSPDGSHVAGLFAVRGEQRILLMPVFGDRSRSVMVGVPDQTEIAWLRWVNDDNLVVGLYALQPIAGDNWYISRMIAISRTTGKVTKLLWDVGGQNGADLLWVPTDGSNHILVAAQNSIYVGEDFWPSVYRVDVTNGRKRVVLRGRSGVMDWGVDHFGRIRYGIGYSDATTRATLLYRSGGEGSFRLIERASLRNEEELTVPFLFLPGTDHGYVIDNDDDGRSVVAEIDLATGKPVRTVYAVDGSDVDGIEMSFDGSRLLGVTTTGRDRSIRWIDPVMAEHQKTLDAASPASTVRIESYSRNLDKMLVRISTPDNPGLLYYYDAATGALDRLAAINEAIGGKRLSRARLVQYKARDGLEIEAVLTMPRGRAAKGLPFIVMPHGGPWAHDELGYDYWAQFLAERGYAVLQPNFRGSTGYGEDFLRAGQGQLGFAMQDDVSDGVRWAVGEGIADAKRVCIVGASYGGYAAMWGVARDPDQYRCAIAIAGVSNLRREVNDFGGAVRARLYRDQWRKMTPDFAAVSPINAIGRIKAPLLLIHGRKDVTVDHGQSARMYAAMQDAGKTVEFVSIPLADHYFTREADRLTLLGAIDDFLRRYNPPD